MSGKEGGAPDRFDPMGKVFLSFGSFSLFLRSKRKKMNKRKTKRFNGYFFEKERYLSEKN